jgi:hypothetical protein
VNPAMQTALSMVQKFASDVCEGKIPENRLSFGAPWRHPPRTDNPDTSYKWAKIQLMDFVESFVNTEFGVTILFRYKLGICTFALIEIRRHVIGEVTKFPFFPLKSIHETFYLMYLWIPGVLVFSLCTSQLNYLADDSLEILDDPAAVAMMEVFRSIFVWY